MPDSLVGTVIDCLEFARGGGYRECKFRLEEFPRLADLLSSKTGFLSVELEGSRDEEGKSWLRVRVAGELLLGCQRCLNGVRFPLDIQSRLQLIASGEDWPDDDLADDSADAIEADAALAVLPLIEDEVLLALPIAPRHEQCERPSAGAAEHGSSPFAALAALKKR